MRHLFAFQRGVTLVELIVSIVVISVALAGLLIVIDRTTRSSSDPLVRNQAVAVAEAYLEEILARPFCDPDNANLCTPGNAPESPNCQVCPPAEGARDLYDNVCDYNGLPDTVVRDQNGGVIPGLESYSVQVAILTNDTLGPAGDQLDGSLCELLTVQVSVAGPANTNVSLIGHRANY